MKYFGTDGIRGVPFTFPFEPDFIRKIGYSIGRKLRNSNNTVFIARDTRESGRKIINYIAEGLGALNLRIIDLGIITTPSLAYILSKNEVSFGIMISASHNPPEFNGIKILSSKGEKISEEIEREIEDIIDSTNNIYFKKAKLEKKVFSFQYVDYVVKFFVCKLNLNNKIVIDCANGAAYKIAPFIFKKLGMNIFVIGNKPDGKNINVGCGALETDMLKKTVIKNNAFCGISYDGDGDRCIIIDENGEIIDGDDIIALFAYYYKKKNLLRNNTIVLTQMSNYGLFRFLKQNKIKVLSVDVGDRNVSNLMKRKGAVLGGEPSGHIILKKYLNTGDGIITSLEFLRIVSEMGIKVSDVKKMWDRFPSFLKSYRVEKKIPFQRLDGFLKFVSYFEKNIGGRIFIRYSGTEPVLRILIEAEVEKDKMSKISDEIFDYYRKIVDKIEV